MKRLCFWKPPNLKNFRVEMHTATPIKLEYLATLAIWTLFTSHSHGSRYHSILADIFCFGQWTDIKLPLKRTTWYWTVSENLNRAVQKREKEKKKKEKQKRRREKLVTELMLMWLSRFQLSSPRCRPSPSPTPQVFSVHPSLSSTSSPSS